MENTKVDKCLVKLDQSFEAYGDGLGCDYLGLCFWRVIDIHFTELVSV